MSPTRRLAVRAVAVVRLFLSVAAAIFWFSGAVWRLGLLRDDDTNFLVAWSPLGLSGVLLVTGVVMLVSSSERPDRNR